MSPLIETIRLHDGQFYNVAYHERRMQQALGAEQVDLTAILEKVSAPSQGLFKCRMVYDHQRHHVEFIPYEARTVHSLQLVYDDEISYPHKFEDRSALDRHFEKRGQCDDILIIRKGWVTDASAANIVFRRGKTWMTPSTCLLPGTQRQFLLDHKVILEEEVRVSDITRYTAFKLINAMVMFESQEVSTGNIMQ